MEFSSAKRSKEETDNLIGDDSGLAVDQVLDAYERKIRELIHVNGNGLVEFNDDLLSELNSQYRDFALRLKISLPERTIKVIDDLVGIYYTIIKKQIDGKIAVDRKEVDSFLSSFGLFLYNMITVRMGSDLLNVYHLVFDLFGILGMEDKLDTYDMIKDHLGQYIRGTRPYRGGNVTYYCVAPIQMEWMNYRGPGEEATFTFEGLLPNISSDGTMSNYPVIKERLFDMFYYKNRFVYRSDAEALNAFVNVMPMFRREFVNLMKVSMGNRLRAWRTLSNSVRTCVSGIANTDLNYSKWLFYIAFGTDELKVGFEKEVKLMSDLPSTSLNNNHLSFDLKIAQGDIPDKYKYGENGVTLTPENVTGLYVIRKEKGQTFVYVLYVIITRLSQYVQEADFSSMNPQDAFAVADALLMECLRYTKIVSNRGVINVESTVRWRSYFWDIVYLLLKKMLKQPEEKWLPLVEVIILHGDNVTSPVAQEARKAFEKLFMAATLTGKTRVICERCGGLKLE